MTDNSQVSSGSSPAPARGDLGLGSVGLFVVAVTSLASVLLFANAGSAWAHIGARPTEFATKEGEKWPVLIVFQRERK